MVVILMLPGPISPHQSPHCLVGCAKILQLRVRYLAASPALLGGFARASPTDEPARVYVPVASVKLKLGLPTANGLQHADCFLSLSTRVSARHRATHLELYRLRVNGGNVGCLPQKHSTRYSAAALLAAERDGAHRTCGRGVPSPGGAAHVGFSSARRWRRSPAAKTVSRARRVAPPPSLLGEEPR